MPFCYICNVHLVVYRSECSDNIHSLCPQRNTCKAVSSPFSVKEGLSVTENKPYKIFTLKLLGHSISLSKTTRVCNIVIILHTVMVGQCTGHLEQGQNGYRAQTRETNTKKTYNQKYCIFNPVFSFSMPRRFYYFKNTVFSIQCFHSPYNVDFYLFQIFCVKMSSDEASKSF